MGALGIRESWGELSWDKGIGHGAASEPLLELVPRKSLQNCQSTGTKGLGVGGVECAKCKVEADNQFCQAWGQRVLLAPSHQTQAEA